MMTGPDLFRAIPPVLALNLANANLVPGEYFFATKVLYFYM